MWLVPSFEMLVRIELADYTVLGERFTRIFLDCMDDLLKA